MINKQNLEIYRDILFNCNMNTSTPIKSKKNTKATELSDSRKKEKVIEVSSTKRLAEVHYKRHTGISKLDPR